MRTVKRLLPTIALLIAAPAFAQAPTAPLLYEEHCASCHGSDRLGGMGPALLPENLGRLRENEAAEVIAKGRPATQMPAFDAQLSKAEIDALVELIYTPLPEAPNWGLAEMTASHAILTPPEQLADAPQFKADPLNLFIVVEVGDHHATLLDGDSFEPITRFQTHFALHGGPKYSPDGRFVYFASRDGWISKYDIYSMKHVAEVRAGINTRNIAVSDDGRYVLVGNYLPHSVVVLDANNLVPLDIIPAADTRGHSSRVSAVYTAPPRGSFIVALKDVPELWEIPYREDAVALPVYKGPMHDFRPESGEDPPIDEAAFPVRRIYLNDVLDDFFFDDAYQHVVGAARTGGGQVVNLDAGRAIAKIDLPGMPHLGSGITFQHKGRTVMATPNLKEGSITVIDTRDWSVIKRIKTNGPGFFMRSHENTPYLWTDVFFGPHKDEVLIIDKETLEIVKTLKPAPGKTAAHTEFTRDGSHALVSIWEEDGAVVVYDAETLEEVERIPMAKPSGKYNVYNKINYASGTSH